jgi:hypothetical protein
MATHMSDLRFWLPRLRASAVVVTVVSILGALFVARPWIETSAANARNVVLLIACFHAIMLGATAIAFRWTRYGGIVMAASALTLGGVLWTLAAAANGIGEGARVLLALWMVPYVVIAVLFYVLSQHTQDTARGGVQS